MDSPDRPGKCDSIDELCEVAASASIGRKVSRTYFATAAAILANQTYI